MAWFGASARDVAIGAPGFVFTQLFWVLLLLTLAALTPSLTRFVVAVAASVAAFGVGMSAIMTFVVLNQPEERLYYDSPSVPDATSEIVASVLLMCAAFGVIAYQYRRRWLSRAILIGVAGAVAAAIVASVWPWRFARAIEPDPGVWAHDSTRSIAVLDAQTNVSEAYSLRHAKTPKKQVAARIDLLGAPADYDVESVGVRARLVFPDGTTIESAQRESAVMTRPAGDRPSNRVARLQAVLGDARLMPDPGDIHDTLPVIIKVTNPNYQRYGEQSGHLSATLDLSLNQVRIFGSLPLSTGAVVRDALDRFEIVRVVRRSDGCDVLVRHLSVLPMWRPRSHPQFHLVLRNTSRREAIAGDEQTGPVSEFNMAGMLFGISRVRGEGGFSVWTRTLRYPTHAASASGARQIDSAWLDGAELVVIESAYAGHFTRSLEVDGFKMRP